MDDVGFLTVFDRGSRLIDHCDLRVNDEIVGESNEFVESLVMCSDGGFLRVGHLFTCFISDEERRFFLEFFRVVAIIRRYAIFLLKRLETAFAIRDDEFLYVGFQLL